MKILRVTHSINPQYGGIASSLVESAQASSDYGIEMDIVCLDDPNDAFLDNISIRYFALGPAKGNYGYTPKLSQWLKQHAYRYDKIIIDGIWQHPLVATSLTLQKLGIPYYIYVHGMLSPWFKETYPLKHLKKWLFWLIFGYRAFKHADAVFYTSSEEQRLAQQSFSLYRAKERIAPLGLHITGNDFPQAESMFLNKFPALSNQPFILFMGRLHPVKAVDLLIKAFSKTENRAKLVIAGPADETYLNELKTLIKQCNITEDVIFTGMLDQETKWGALKSCSAFVLPSHQENFGMVAVEAMSCAKPVILSNKVNIWKEVDQHQAAIICDDTEASLSKALETFTQLSSEEISKLGQNAYQTFCDRFSIESSLNTLKSALEHNELPET